MPRPFGTHHMSTTSELLYGVLFLLLALIARSAALSLPANFLRDGVGMLSVIMLLGGLIVIVVDLWHAASRAESRARSRSPITSEPARTIRREG